MTRTFVDPARDFGDRGSVLLAYLDYFRGSVAEKAATLTDDELRSTRLPSGWTPLELLTHLLFMERRWVVWGFLAEQVADPWGDHGDNDCWSAPPQQGLETLVGRLREQGRRTREVVESGSLDQRAALGGRFTTPAEAPTLERILLHVLQEYARHAGHLDIVVELATGATGE